MCVCVYVNLGRHACMNLIPHKAAIHTHPQTDRHTHAHTHTCAGHNLMDVKSDFDNAYSFALGMYVEPC